jgi:hypothetical protein
VINRRALGGWLVSGTVSYVKLIVRSECVVISFHEDEGDADEEA